MSKPEPMTLGWAPLVGLMAWLLPGLGHVLVGERGRGLVIFVTITVTFWTGVAIGGAGAAVNPQQRKLWFMAQLLTGTHSMAAYALHHRVIRELPPSARSPFLASWQSTDIAVHYTGIAGLLNLLVIFDAITRADVSAVERRRHGLTAREGP